MIIKDSVIVGAGNLTEGLYCLCLDSKFEKSLVTMRDNELSAINNHSSSL